MREVPQTAESRNMNVEGNILPTIDTRFKNELSAKQFRSNSVAKALATELPGIVEEGEDAKVEGEKL